MKEVFDNIQRLLAQKKISRKALCEKLGVSKNVYQNWVSGHNQSYMKRLDEVSTFLQVPITDLYIDTSVYDNLMKSFEERRLKEEPSFTENERNLINLYRMLKENDKEKVKQLLLDLLLEN